MVDAAQAWFWTPTWQAGEAEAAAEIARGNARVFESGDDLMASLDDK